ncbi:MAG: GNAT family N-acetyltransferase [Chloroflexi bacterium]|nr:GNAT family N-acetyltransferase [Chloroflexota bacterium]
MNLRSFDPTNPNHISAIVAIWNAACGPDLAISPRFVEFNTRGATGSAQGGLLAVQHGEPVGCVIASALPHDPSVSPPETGWVDLIAVRPDARRQGIGGSLLGWAEEWLREQGCAQARLGGSLRPFVPGLPDELRNDGFFRPRGYTGRANGEFVWDVARDLSDYEPRRANCSPSFHFGDLRQFAPQVRPAQPGDQAALLEFFYCEFPNRWRFEFQEFLRRGGRISDWMILLTERGIDGFARLTFEDSIQPYERYYPYRLPRPWGQLGPIGVSAGLRGKGCGGQLLDAALVRLRDSGVKGCIIDWTGLLDFYAKFGFQPYRKYLMLIKHQL